MIRCNVVLSMFLIVIISIVTFVFPERAAAKGMWSKVASSSQGDVWYIDQSLAYEDKHSKVITSRAYLKCVPGKESELGEQVRDMLDASGVVPARFDYFIGSVAVNCSTRLFHFSEITFYDGEDRVLFHEDFDERQYYAAIADHPSENVSHYLCLDKSGFLDTLKKQEPFLYLFSK